jgi:hypothetical protein
LHRIDPPYHPPTPNSQTSLNAHQKKPKKPSRYFTKKFQKKSKKIPKKVFKKWDPLLDALIPDQFEFLQSDQ